MTNKYCFCLSGQLGKVVLDNILTNQSINIEVILTDRKSDGVIEIANRNNIPLFIGNPRGKRASDFCKNNNIVFDYILSINYLFILEDDFLVLPKYGINFHGSLLPKYRGRTPHVWAIINGETETGITAHLMNSKCDDGDIVRQLRIPIMPEDTGAMILEKFNCEYPDLVWHVIEDIENNSLQPKKQERRLATYFGKRTPEDGEINWDWQKERIRNWVRAQAAPYPGAFTYLGDVKVIINKLSYSDEGFIDTMQNGMVIAMNGERPIIKTPNGAVILEDFYSQTTIKTGDIFERK